MCKNVSIPKFRKVTKNKSHLKLTRRFQTLNFCSFGLMISPRRAKATVLCIKLDRMRFDGYWMCLFWSPAERWSFDSLWS